MGIHAKHRALVGALSLVLLAGPAGACRLALILAMDVSSSVDPAEDALQRGGMAAALLAPQVVDAFLVSNDPVALAVFEWSGRYNQAGLVTWTEIRSRDDLVAVSAAIAGSRRSHNDFPTAVGYALGHAATLFQTAPDCGARTVDIAGDGVNNEGFGPAEAYDAFPFDDITVNGLVVNAGDYEGSPELLDFYLEQVRHGPGAFVEVANGFDDYERTMTRKLLRELMAQVVGGLDGRDMPQPLPNALPG